MGNLSSGCASRRGWQGVIDKRTPHVVHNLLLDQNEGLLQQRQGGKRERAGSRMYIFQGYAIVKLFCQCGYPIRVAGNWNGKEYRLRLFDGEQGTQEDPITHCPRCGEAVHPGDLHWVAPVTLPLMEQHRPIDVRHADEQEAPSSGQPA